MNGNVEKVFTVVSRGVESSDSVTQIPIRLASCERAIGNLTADCRNTKRFAYAGLYNRELLQMCTGIFLQICAEVGSDILCTLGSQICRWNRAHSP